MANRGFGRSGSRECICFDVDGTLSDADLAIAKAIAPLIGEILEEKHIRRPQPVSVANILNLYGGKTFRQIMRTLAEDKEFGFFLDHEELEEMNVTAEQRRVIGLRQDAKPAEGIMEVLQALDDARIPMAAVSSSSDECMVASMANGPLKYFPKHRRFSAADLNPPSAKPDSAVYRHALKMLDLSPKQVWVLEDTVGGISAARSAKIEMTIGYGGCVPAEKKDHHVLRLMQAGACLVLHDWREFPDLLGVR